MPQELLALIRRYGGAPLVKRTLEVSTATLDTMEKVAGGNMGAAGLLWNERGRVLLVRHQPPSQWGNRWVTPGGSARTGEKPEDNFLREVWEEVRLRPRILDLTCVYELTVTKGERGISGFFFQFEALARDSEPSLGPGIEEARWFQHLPPNMAFRDDYSNAFRRRRGAIIRGAREAWGAGLEQRE